MLGIALAFSARGDPPSQVVVEAGKRYRASWLTRLFLGQQWRDLWTTPMELPVLDLASFDGGLTPDRVIGVHVNALVTFPTGDPADMAAMTEADQRRLAAMQEWQQRSGAYMQVQGTRPQTIAHSLTDSPAGLLAWIVEKFQEWTDPAAALPEDAVDRDRILTDVSIYWFTATAGSAAHTYYERFNDPAMWVPRERSAVPTAVAVFTTDVTVRPFAAKTSNVVRWSEFTRGGHFAALEAPDLLISDLRDFFRPLS